MAAAQRGKLGIVSLVIGGLGPLVTYFVIRPHAGSDTAALAIAWLIPVGVTLVSSVLRRRLDLFGMAGVLLYGIALFVAIVLGAGSLALKLHHAAATAVVGIACLVSVAIDRPLLALVLRFYARWGVTSVDATTILSRRTLTTLTLLIGTVCIVDTTLQIALALTLSTGQYLLAKTAVHIVSVIVIGGGAVSIFRYRARHAREERTVA